jgi:hypothetical protein
MSEANLRRRVLDGLRHEGADVQRHEDMYSAGIPDLSYALRGIDGWLELKHVKAWPARASSLVRLDKNPTKFLRQLLWLRRRALYGGSRCYVFAQVQASYLLLAQRAFADPTLLAGGLPAESLRLLACAAWEGSLPTDELAKELIGRRA